MCGIIARINPAGLRVAVEECRRATAMVIHRGPDAHGEWISEHKNVYLGFRRLSILDLSDAANQPMAGAEGTFLIFNGEIYNYQDIRTQLESKGARFRTSGDTEVLLRALEAWGEDILPRIEGMFSFLFWNNRAGEALAARDFFGIKPFYFWLPPSGGICVASEIKSFYAFSDFSPEVNTQALPEYLRFRSLVGSTTLLKNVLQLPPGHLLHYSSPTGQVTTGKYWTPLQVLGKCSTDHIPMKCVHEHFQETVQRHLIADVPVGAQLSGGVDSGLSLAMARSEPDHHMKGFHCSVDDASCNESFFAARVAKQLNTDLQVVSLTGEIFFSDLLDKLTWHMDEPLGHSNAIGVHLVSALARPQVKVLISGEAADELFAGYHRYSALLCHEGLRRHAVVHSFLTRLPRFDLKFYRAVKTAALWATSSTEEEIVSGMQFLSPEILGNLIGPENILASEYSRRSYLDTLPPLDPLTRCQIFDLWTYLPGLLIRQDKMSMAASIENRVPFATPLMASVALNLAPELRATLRQQKVVLKKIFSAYVSDAIAYRKKVGFGIPLARWFATPAGAERLAWLGQRSCPVNDYVDSYIIRRLLGTYRGTEAEVETLWILLTLGIWLELVSDKSRAAKKVAAESTVVAAH
jgi:asparagine synthase (glutamine-hydrolysing)